MHALRPILPGDVGQRPEGGNFRGVASSPRMAVLRLLPDDPATAQPFRRDGRSGDPTTVVGERAAPIEEAAAVNQSSTCSAMLRASSTSIPR